MPHDVDARINLSNLLLRAGDRTGALEQLDSALSFEPNSVDIRYRLAKVLLSVDRAVEANRHLRLILQRDATHEGALSLLAESPVSAQF